MQKLLFCSLLSLCLSAGIQAQSRSRPVDLKGVEQPLDAKGVKWYTTWETGLKEAQRSNKPIFFFAAAAQCGNVSGTF